MRKITRIAAGVLTVGVALSNPALAQDSPFGPVTAAIGSLWQRVGFTFGSDTVAPITESSPTSLLRGIQGGTMFWDGLRDAGYEVKEVTTGVGIIPDVKMSFQLMRELSDADRDALERKIEIDETRRGGLTAVIQRQILRTLLAASNLQDMRITKLDITLLPLPAAEFVMEPKESPLSEEHDALLRALQGHSEEARGAMKKVRTLKPGIQSTD
jgi:hypothetical protein